MTADPVQAAVRQHSADRWPPAGTTDPPRSLAELLSRHAQAALAVSGAGQTAWNGQVVEAGDGILGLAHWDGTLHLDRESILDPLRELYLRAGDHHPKAALTRYREALVTMLHEQSHFLGPAGATQEAARLAFKQPGSRALEEGVAEAWAHARLDRYLTELGIDRVAPGIERVTGEASYQAFVPAVRILTADLDQRAGSPSGTTLDRLNRETAEGQWPLVVDLVYRSSDLPAVVPPEHEDGVRLGLENTLRESFTSLALFEPLPRGFAASRSSSIAHQCLARLNDQVTATYQHFTHSPSNRNRPTPQHLGLQDLGLRHLGPLGDERVLPAPPSAGLSQPLTSPFRHAFAGIAPPTVSAELRPTGSEARAGGGSPGLGAAAETAAERGG